MTSSIPETIFPVDKFPFGQGVKKTDLRDFVSAVNAFGSVARDEISALQSQTIQVAADQVSYTGAIVASNVEEALNALANAIDSIVAGEISLPIVDNNALIRGSGDETKLWRVEVDHFDPESFWVFAPPNKHWNVSDYGSTIVEASDAASARGVIGAAAVGHTHPQSEVQGLEESLAGKANVSHTHSAEAITSGTFADGRISQSSVKNHEAALNHDVLTNFVTNKHIDHSAVAITGQHSVAGGGDITTGRTLSLVNDTAAPGANKVYGTDGEGNRLWKNDPAGGGANNTQHSVEGDGSAGTPLQLVGDVATPGNNKVYGTSAAGARVWKDDPAGGDMSKATYDPGNINGDAFSRALHTGTQTLATISDKGDLAAHTTGVTVGVTNADLTYSRATHGDHALILFSDFTASRILTLPAAEGVKGATIRVRLRNSSGFMLTVRAEDPNNLGTYAEINMFNEYAGTWRKDNDGTAWWTNVDRGERGAQINPAAVGQAEAEAGTAEIIRGWSALRVRQSAIAGLPPDASQEEMEAGTEGAIRMVSPLRVKQAIQAQVEGATVPPPTTYEITASQLLSLSDPDQRAHRNFIGVVTAAAAITVPKAAGPGSVWILDVATAGAVTVAVEDNAGSVNGATGGSVTAAGEGAALTVMVRANAGTAPEVVVKGDTTEAVKVAGDYDFNGKVVKGQRNPLDDELTGAQTLSAANFAAGSTLIHTGAAATYTITARIAAAGPTESLLVRNDGTGDITFAASGVTFKGDTSVLEPGKTRGIEWFHRGATSFAWLG